MPTKDNRWRQQQNYNADDGEYSSGFARGTKFKSFKKPKQEDKSKQSDQSKQGEKNNEVTEKTKVGQNNKKQSVFDNISLEGINKKNQEEIISTIKTVVNDFPFLETSVSRITTEKGAKTLIAKQYAEFKGTEKYKEEIKKYKQQLKQWNGRDFSDEEVERYYTSVWNKRKIIKGRFLGVCSVENINGENKDFIQVKNSDYESARINNKYYESQHGYPFNAELSFGGTVAHELGHAVANYLFKKGIFGEYQDTLAINDISAIRRRYDKPVSGYSLTNTAEYIAECICSHYADRNNEQAEEVFNYILSKAKGKKV